MPRKDIFVCVSGETSIYLPPLCTYSQKAEANSIFYLMLKGAKNENKSYLITAIN